MQGPRPNGVVRSALLLGSLALLLSALAPRAVAQTASPESAEPPAAGELTYPLEGTRWRLESYASDGEMRPVAPDIDAWLRLGKGRVAGSTGCTSLRGTHVPIAVGRSDASPAATAASSPVPASTSGLPTDGVVGFRELQVGIRDCAEQTMLVATAVIDGLDGTVTYRLDARSPAWETRLELLDAAGRTVLRYRVDDVGTLAGTTWLLETVNGTRALTGSDGQPAVLTLDVLPNDADPATTSRISGSTGCTGFSGDYFATGNVLSVRELTTTGEACSPDRTEQDRVVRGILEATSLRVSLPPGALVLQSDDDERTLVYRKAAALEGQTWVLDGRDAARLGGDPVVTLLLAADAASGSDATQRAGRISGQGPCRSFEGSYRTDGLLVRFDAVRSGPGRCGDPRAERGWERRLRRAVFAEVDAGRLRLRDRYGRVLASLDTPSLP